MTQVAAQAIIVPPTAKTEFRSLGDGPLEVYIDQVLQNVGEDVVEILCKYPNGYQKYHQMFLVDKTSRLLEYMVQTFRGVYDVGVVPTGPMPPATELPGSTISFTKGE